MKETESSNRWEQPDASRYPDTIALKIPAYDQLYRLTERLMSVLLNDRPEPSDIVVIGAGGGQELETLGSRHMDWRFTAIDPSARMLETAKHRAECAGIGRQVSWLQGEINQLPCDAMYDAATCMLVLQFVQGLEAKRSLLREAAARLKPGAPLFLASINGEPGTFPVSVQLEAWRGHMLDQGIPEQEFDRFSAAIGREHDTISAALVTQLLAEAGFGQTTHYFGSFLINAWMCIKI